MSAKTVSQDVMAVSLANNHFGINIYNQLLLEEKKTFIFSPFSISTAMAMLFFGAKSDTAQEMRSVLGYEEANIQDKQLKSSFQTLLNELEKNPESYVLECANSMVTTQKDFTIKQDFNAVLKESFKALLRQVDFANESREAVLQINQWVKDKTKGMIPQLLDSLHPSTVMVILNAVYFKGLWVEPFKKSSTYKQIFYNGGMESNGKDVDMMHIKKSFPYTEKDTFKALQLPYKGNEIAMLLLLPTSTDGLSKVESLLSSTFIQDLKPEMQKMKVEVALPKFKLEFSAKLKEVFQKLGISRAFDSKADFGGISDKKGVFVSEIIHKAVIDVTEEGTEAAAATAMMMLGSSFMSKPDPKFIVDHPFLFVIYNLKSNLILFMGRVNEL